MQPLSWYPSSDVPCCPVHQLTPGGIILTALPITCSHTHSTSETEYSFPCNLLLVQLCSSYRHRPAGKKGVFHKLRFNQSTGQTLLRSPTTLKKNKAGAAQQSLAEFPLDFRNPPAANSNKHFLQISFTATTSVPFKSQTERDAEPKESYLNFLTDLQEQNTAKPTTENYLRYQLLEEVGMVLGEQKVLCVHGF